MTSTTQANYANINGIQMYYEIHGAGNPLVLVHGGGSTIQTSFGKILPLLAQSHKVIAVELQAHGHTGDRNAPESFVQDADDIAELLRQLDIPQADIFGFSNGGQTAMQMAISHPEKVRRLIIASAFYKRAGTPAGFWEGFKDATINDMPQLYKTAFAKINSDPAALMNMFNKDSGRMRDFKDWAEEDIRAIKAPALIVIGDQILTLPEHAVEMHRTLQNSRLAIIPGTHGSYMGEALSPNPDSKIPELLVAMVNEFLG